MLTDPFDQQLADLLKAARPGPPPGWRSQALAALAGVRPRRHPNLLTYIIVAALILLLAAGVFAAVRYFFYVEGTLLFVNNYGQSPEPRYVSSVRILSGEVEWQVDEVWHGATRDVSYATGESLLMERDRFPRPRTGDIIKAKLDGSDPVNLTGRAGVGGVNCGGEWSPDRSMILFWHSHPGEDECPGDVESQIWVMNADGTGARQVTPASAYPTKWQDPRWGPDGSRFICRMSQRGDNATVTMDIWGQDIRVLPNVGFHPAWSPDGSMIASIIAEEQQVDGEPGMRQALLLTEADGSDPRVLVEQFIATADAEASSRRAAQLDSDERHDSADGVQFWAGPRDPEWSPHSDKIAFLAALPFDASRLRHRCQTEVWVYDLRADELIRVTNDDVEQNNVHWK